MSEPTKVEWDAAEDIDDALSNCSEGETVNFSEMARIISKHTEPLHTAGQAMRDYLAQYVEKCGESGAIPCHCGEIDPLISAWDKANGKE